MFELFHKPQKTHNVRILLQTALNVYLQGTCFLKYADNIHWKDKVIMIRMARENLNSSSHEVKNVFCSLESFCFLGESLLVTI